MNMTFQMLASWEMSNSIEQRSQVLLQSEEELTIEELDHSTL